MIDDVNTNRIVLVQGVGNLQLGTYSVNAGRQNWLVISLEFEKPAKEPDAAQDLRAESGAGVLPNQLFYSSRNININPGSGIGFLNLPCLLRYLRLLRPAAAKGATTNQRVIVTNIAMG